MDNFNLKKYLVENKVTRNSKLLNETDMADQYKVPDVPGEDWGMKAFKNWEKWIKSVGKKNAIRKDAIDYFIDYVVEFDGFDDFVTEQSVLDELETLKKIGHLDHLDFDEDEVF